jgi:hypothetical protein
VLRFLCGAGQADKAVLRLSGSQHSIVTAVFDKDDLPAVRMLRLNGDLRKIVQVSPPGAPVGIFQVLLVLRKLGHALYFALLSSHFQVKPTHSVHTTQTSYRGMHTLCLAPWEVVATMRWTPS